MRPLSPEELKELREELTELDMPAEQLDEMIRLVDAIVISFIDQHFGLGAVQLSLSTRANRAFSKEDSCGDDQSSNKLKEEITKNSENEPIDISNRKFSP